MARGDIYLLDARVPHAGGNFGVGAARIHLIIDADADIPLETLFRSPEEVLTGGDPVFVERASLSDGDLDKLKRGLAAIMTPANYPMCVAITKALPFTHDFNTGAVYDLVVDAAARSGNGECLALAQADRTFYFGY
jgi:hypothetical protein